jgi:hypothetical protein
MEAEVRGLTASFGLLVLIPKRAPVPASMLERFFAI